MISSDFVTGGLLTVGRARRKNELQFTFYRLGISVGYQTYRALRNSWGDHARYSDRELPDDAGGPGADRPRDGVSVVLSLQHDECLAYWPIDYGRLLTR